MSSVPPILISLQMPMAAPRTKCVRVSGSALERRSDDRRIAGRVTDCGRKAVDLVASRNIEGCRHEIGDGYFEDRGGGAAAETLNETALAVVMGEMAVAIVAGQMKPAMGKPEEEDSKPQNRRVPAVRRFAALAST